MTSCNENHVLDHIFLVTKNIRLSVGKRDFLAATKPHGYTIINNYAYVISSQTEKSFYLKCANFRLNNCRARAIIRKDTMVCRMRRVPHNHPEIRWTKKRLRKVD